jgi:type I restriction enzyme R subunit
MAALTPEEQARQVIDAKLCAAGWIVRSRDQLDLSAGPGIAVAKFPLKLGFGEADYLLYVDRKAIGVVEAKAVGHTLTGVEPQSACYSEGLPDNLPAWHRPLPFLYESTGEVTQFTNTLDPEPRSRDVFHFHRPDTLLEWVRGGAQTRARFGQMPPVDATGLWGAQLTAILNLERSFALNRPRALIQMATGSGKTYTAANFVYRLVKHAGARRVLFLVDRSNLGGQTYREFCQFQPPAEGRRFGELYNVQFLRSNALDRASRVVITTVQRLYSMLRGDPDLDPADEMASMFDRPSPLREPPPVAYNPTLPIEAFDFIVVDECHRSIYSLWRQVLEYFDAFIIGLTATPSKQTVGFFRRNLVMEYTHAQAVADNVNVGFDVYRISTRISERGSTVEAGLFVDVRDRRTRRVRYEELDDDLTYTPDQLDRDVVAEDQIRTVVRTFRDKLFTEIFPGRTEVPKTLIFAKDDSHADDIVKIVREEFARGNDFCQKITYRTGFLRTVDLVTNEEGIEEQVVNYDRIANLSPEDVLRNFRTSYLPRIAVTVDMVATGTDIKPVEIVMFLRNVKSATYFEQMKGRGVRVITPDELLAVTPDARLGKTRFVIVDCVGVCEHDKSDSCTLNRKPHASLEQLLDHVAMGGLDPDVLTTLAARLARLQPQCTTDQQHELAQLAQGADLSDIARGLVRATDPDEQDRAARQQAGIPLDAEPTEDQVRAAAETLAREAVGSLLNARFRRRILEIKAQNEQTIDRVSLDEVTVAGFDAAARDKARNRIASFRQWIEANRDEILALQVLYSGRYANRLKFEDIKDLAARIARPPLDATPEELWHAYEALERSAVRGSGGRQLTDLVSLVRHTLNPDEALTPFRSVVQERYEAWLAEQARAGAQFTPEQRQWLDRIADHIATSVTMEIEDFDMAPFVQEGGLGRAHQLFGDRLNALLAELNEKLVA